MDTANETTRNELREQLRVGVRMLEALELQLNRGEDIIRREEDARRRAESTIASLEALEQRVLEVMESMPRVFPQKSESHGDPLRSGSLQVSPPGSLVMDTSSQFEAQLHKAETMRKEFSRLVERAEAARSELDQSGTRLEADQLAHALHQLADELIATAHHNRTTSRGEAWSLNKPLDIDPSTPAPKTRSGLDS